MSDNVFLRLFAYELAKERKRLKLSQKRVIAETGIQIGRIESYKNSITLRTYFALCNYLKIPLDLIPGRIEEERNNLEQ
ncbi:MAG: helix-turn-helix transcriptional regulator [Bacteroidetes bacterium]|jgi:transcriptional regulator with XRE-family HTH domain|nr:helix-turn-helix transcriptional regulator [Bacteroidota bacterium]MBT3750682.1 helix-turn-helix transcriptional regulator [Bacteroidota bacterium]MBT4401882.1 helix-turn-helix transcriptional regulator [Bacteroidota bacterium]MBT4408412.1 helix-turn-helix transcriptional regulator [Bacteroidota bacterium]MBT7095321.1 helix-turn-helix transcriptional regulator [Bacteroidota bacterium]